MLRRRHEPAFHRIIMQILKLLQHHLVAPDRLRMNCLLPNLVIALMLMRGAKVDELIEQLFPALNLESIENRVSRELF